MENDPLKESSELIPIEDLKGLVNMWSQRETGSEEVDHLERMGGDSWVIRGLNTHQKQGINSSTIKARTKRYGTNVKNKRELQGFWKLVGDALQDFLLRVLIVAGIASIAISVGLEADHRSTAWIEGAAILLSVVIVVLVNVVNDMKKEREFQKLNEQAEAGKKAILTRDGETVESANPQSILVGDLIQLRAGMEVPGDGYILEAFSLQLDESSLTGESKVLVKECLAHCLNKKTVLLKKEGTSKLGLHSIPSPIVLAGTKVLSGTGTAIVINVGKHSAIGKIKEIVDAGEEELTPLQLKLEKIARDIGWFGLISALVIFAALIIRFIIENSQHNDPIYAPLKKGWQNQSGLEHVERILQYVLIAVTVLVVAIPEGLPLAVTLSLAYSVSKMMKDNNLVRKLQACETMGGANIICSDKTGTLTRNEMFWTHFWNSKEIEVFNSEKNAPLPFDSFVKNGSLDVFLNTIVFNSIENPAHKDGNPTELAMLKLLQLNKIEVLPYREKGERIFQANFTSDRKRMSTIIKLPNGDQFIFLKGASEYILNTSDRFLELDAGNEIAITPQIKKAVEEGIEGMATKALRTIGISYKKIGSGETVDTENPDDNGLHAFEKSGFTLLGICGIKDIIRSEVPESIRKCYTAGIQVKMVTGDNRNTARAIAKEVGIINAENESTALVMEGPEFLRRIGGVVCANCIEAKVCECVVKEADMGKAENKGKKLRKDTIMNKAEFDEIWKDLCVLSRSRPEDKYALVIGLKERGNVVAVTGDGTNDAPALSKASVGFAMGITGTEVAKEAASILIMDDNFASIVNAVRWGRNIYDSIRKFIQFQLTVNVVAVLLTFVSAVTIEEAVLSTVQMLWINLVMDTFAALALATEPPYDELLERPPHSKTDYIISPVMLRNIIFGALYQLAVTCILLFAGPNFLVDPIGKRQLQPNSNLIVSGRAIGILGAVPYDKELYGNQYSIHYTYIFNVFVMMTWFNFFNCRILDDKYNIFTRIKKSFLMIMILILIIFMQVILLTFTGLAIRVTQWGLDPVGWLISIAIGITMWPLFVLLKFTKSSKVFGRLLKGIGSREITSSEYKRASTMSLKRGNSKTSRTNPKIFPKRSSVVDNVAM